MSSVATSPKPAGTTELHRRLGALREHFETYFDTGWFAILIEGSPIQFTDIREIRTALSRDSLFGEDIRSLEYGVSLLRKFTVRLRRYLMPVLRERLGISGLLEYRPHLSPEAYVYRQLVAATFPRNLERLEELTAELSAELSSA